MSRVRDYCRQCGEWRTATLTNGQRQCLQCGIRRPSAVHCECGEWSGERCEWSGPREETVIVEYMPAQHRASHDAAGNSGSYTHNGASRIRVERSCADRMVEHDGEWCQIVGGAL